MSVFQASVALLSFLLAFPESRGFVASPVSRDYHGHPSCHARSTSNRCHLRTRRPLHLQNGDGGATSKAVEQPSLEGVQQAGDEGRGARDGGGYSGAEVREGSARRQSRNGMFDNVPVQTVSGDGEYTAVLVVPTGIGAAIGGYAGDALPVARALSSVVDNLVTHPNVMNGAMLSWPQPGMQYVEGYALDEFCAGRWGLLPVTKGGHRIGLVLDCAIEDDLRLRHVQAANAARATLGINVAEYCVTEEPAGVTLEMTTGGASWGTVKGLDSLVAAGRRLVEEAGCTAIAVVARFPDDEDEEALQAYREGQGVDAVGGAEAIISHVISQKLKVPCAHAPALPPIDVDESVSPRACAEELGYTFLPCVLSNLHRAPSLITSREHPRAGEALWADAVDAVVAPASAFGGAGVLSLADQATTLLVAVEDNATVMDARAGALLGGTSGSDRCVTVSSYLEAVGVLACHKAGVNPACLTPDVPAIREMPPKPMPAASVGVGIEESSSVDAAEEEGGQTSSSVAMHAEGLRTLVDA
ncbi:unnamed protein product [Scytosiphon promiscuus]